MFVFVCVLANESVGLGWVREVCVLFGAVEKEPGLFLNTFPIEMH